MAIMQPKPPVKPECPPEAVRVEPKSYKGVTVDTKRTPRSSLATFVEGQSWIVDYYSRVIGRDDAVGGLQVGLNEVYQQYKLIRGFEFKVSAPLSQSQNEQTKEMSLTGTANIYGVLVPNEGDMFIADVGDGQEGLFQVTTSRRKTIYADTAHEIDYKMVSYNSELTAEDLNSKVVETLFFSRDLLRGGHTPVIHEKTVDLIEKMDYHYARLVSMYFMDFFSREHCTLVVPNQELPTYDPFIVKFVTSIVGSDEHPYIRQIKELNVYNDQAMYEMTIWNALMTMDYGMLPMIAQEMALIPVRYFYSRPMMNSIYYSRIGTVVYPNQYQTNVDAGYDEVAKKVTKPLVAGATRFRELKRLIANTELITDTAAGPFIPKDGEDCPAIFHVTDDSYYVFTKAFYNYDTDVGELSLLENMARKALKGEPIDLEVLDKLCTGALHWDNLERFYFFPVLFVLLKVYPRGL